MARPDQPAASSEPVISRATSPQPLDPNRRATDHGGVRDCAARLLSAGSAYACSRSTSVISQLTSAPTMHDRVPNDPLLPRFRCGRPLDLRCGRVARTPRCRRRDSRTATAAARPLDNRFDDGAAAHGVIHGRRLDRPHIGPARPDCHNSDRPPFAQQSPSAVPAAPRKQGRTATGTRS
jgi:hypothetical protein